MSRGGLGGRLELCWGRSGASRVALGGSWGGPGASWGRLGGSWARPGALWERLGAVLEPSWAVNAGKANFDDSSMFLEHFRGPRGVPEASWRGLGASWEALGGVLGPLGPVLGGLGASWWCREASWRRLGPSWADLGRALGRHGWILERPGGVRGALPGPRGGDMRLVTVSPRCLGLDGSSIFGL